MSINFFSDILPFYATNVLTDAAYQAGGTYSLPAFFGALTLQAIAVHGGSAGTGYNVGDVVTLTGGTLYSGGAAGTATVVTAPGNVPATLSIKTVGHYVTIPANGISTSGGTGTGLHIDATWTGYAEQRLSTFIEIVRTYMAQIDNNHEAKLLQDVLGRITASISLGARLWDTSAMPTKAQKNALNFVAHHAFSADI